MFDFIRYQPQQDIIILTPDTQGDYSERPYRAPYTYGNCPYGTVKRVKGQAANENLKVKTKYFDPTTPETNTWQANSVPPFSPWGFQVYNVKLWKEDYFQSIATDIVELLFNRFDEDHNGVLSANGEFVVSVFYSVLQYFSSFYQYFCSI